MRRYEQISASERYRESEILEKEIDCDAILSAVLNELLYKNANTAAAWWNWKSVFCEAQFLIEKK